MGYRRLDALFRGLAPARRFRRMLTARFKEVVVGRTIMRNLPPAFVYYVRRPGTLFLTDRSQTLSRWEQWGRSNE
jgi:hypothetical protein